MIDYVLPAVIISVLILLNGLFVAAEFAILGVRPTRLSQLAEAGDATAKTVKQILDDPMRQDRYIATAQLGITLASLGLGMYGEHTVAEWLLGPLERWFPFSAATAHSIAVVAALALLTFAHVVVGEMVPKSLALQYAERTVLGIAGIMAVMKRLFYPAVFLLNSLGNGILRLLGISTAGAQGRLYSAEELELVVTESYKGGLVTDNEQQLIQNIFDFSERRVGQVMTPRRRVVAFPSDMTEGDLRAAITTSPHSRFPIYEADLDHVIGVLLLKDFVSQQLRQPHAFNLKAMLRPLPVVPDTTRVERLLASFKRTHIHMAVVVDEYGGTAGVVTLEDLVEEVVGEVRDEFDQAELPPVREVEPQILVARGDLLIEDLLEAINGQNATPGVSDLSHPGIETVGGLIVTLLGRPARPGDVVRIEGATLIVEGVEGLAVASVRITLDGADGSEPTTAMTTPDPAH